MYHRLANRLVKLKYLYANISDPSAPTNSNFLNTTAAYNYIWYVRDVQGNPLAAYSITGAGSASSGTLMLDEHWETPP